MSESNDSRTNPPDTDDEFRPADMAEGATKPKPVGVKFVLASILLLAFVGYLVYVGFTDPRGPPPTSGVFKD